METYNWIAKSENIFEFITDSYSIYHIILKSKEEHFTNYCSECKNIYEIELKCLSGKSKYDPKVGHTIVKILNEVLSNRCVSLVYICDDSDNKSKGREVLFDNWLEKEANDQVEKYVKTKCTDELYSECLSVHFLSDKTCQNYENDLNEFMCDHM